jgi:hypothetical protein
MTTFLRFAAILAAEYSRLMSADEEETLERLNAFGQS